MRIIKVGFLRDAARQYPKAATYLETWRRIVANARWRGLADVRRDYPSADAVKVKSGKTVFVFNACGNTYRLIAALHFDKQRAFTLRFLTHAEYDKENWKNEL